MHHIARLVSGSTFLVAALLKFLAGPDALGWGPHSALITFEATLSLLLFSGIGARRVLFFTAFCFLAFGGVAAAKLFSGAASCGCFGRVSVSPAYTMVFDLVLCFLCLVAALRMSEIELTHASGRKVALVFCTVVLAGVIWWPYVVASQVATALSAAGAVQGQRILLMPIEWVGKPFPLFTALDDRAAILKQGDWVVLLHRDGCTTCERAIPMYETLVKWGLSGHPSIALIKVPPSERDDAFAWANATLTLSDRWEWFASTPVVVALRGGMVIHVETGEAAIDPTSFLDAAGFTLPPSVSRSAVPTTRPSTF